VPLAWESLLHSLVELLPRSTPVQFNKYFSGTMLPGDEVATFEHSETLYPSRKVWRQGPVHPLPIAATQLKTVHFKSDGKEYDLFDYLADNRIAGLLIVKDGKVVLKIMN
jgi:hypothetical protein